MWWEDKISSDWTKRRRCKTSILWVQDWHIYNQLKSEIWRFRMRFLTIKPEKRYLKVIYATMDITFLWSITILKRSQTKYFIHLSTEKHLRINHDKYIQSKKLKSLHLRNIEHRRAYIKQSVALTRTSEKLLHAAMQWWKRA